MLNQDITYKEAKDLKAGSMTAADILRRHAQKRYPLPLNDRVLLRRVNQDDSKAVKIADAFQPKSNRGVVIAIGPDTGAMLSPGDQVLFSHYSAQDIEVEGEELVILSVHDIWLRL